MIKEVRKHVQSGTLLGMATEAEEAELNLRLIMAELDAERVAHEMAQLLYLEEKDREIRELQEKRADEAERERKESERRREQEAKRQSTFAENQMMFQSKQDIHEDQLAKGQRRSYAGLRGSMP